MPITIKAHRKSAHPTYGVVKAMLNYLFTVVIDLRRDNNKDPEGNDIEGSYSLDWKVRVAGYRFATDVRRVFTNCNLVSGLFSGQRIP